MGSMGLTMDKLLVIALVAMFLLGPDRLPVYAQKLGELVRSVKRMANGAKDRLRDEMGPEFDEVDWRQLDPRQYDPRRIIRDALVEHEREARAEARRRRMQEVAERRSAVSNAPPAADADGGPAGADGAGQTAADAKRTDASDASPSGASGGSTSDARAMDADGDRTPAKFAIVSGDLVLNFDEEAT